MTTLATTLLLRVATTWPLPGLGLLVLPNGPAPHLAAYALHTVVAAMAILPDGTRYAATATVEDITRGNLSQRGPLLDFGAAVALPVGSEIELVPPSFPGLDG